MAVIIDGKKVSSLIKEKLLEETKFIKEKSYIPGLAIVLIGNNPASAIYVRNKQKTAKKLGFFSKSHILPEKTPEKELLELIDLLNKDEKIHGILVQLPLPKHIEEQKVIECISPKKDVDCFHPYNLGKILNGCEEGKDFLPCTPYACLQLLRYYNISTEGKFVAIVGRSNIVGKPLANLMSQKKEYGNATVVLTHSRTKNIKEILRQADIIIAAIGVPLFIKKDMIKNGVVIIDVGINRIKNKENTYSLVGDVDFKDVQEKASYITPVPGGVGPMTVTMLMKNTLLACKKINHIDN